MGPMIPPGDMMGLGMGMGMMAPGMMGMGLGMGMGFGFEAPGEAFLQSPVPMTSWHLLVHLMGL